MIPRVSVLCDTGGPHGLQLFAGLTALRDKGRIHLDYTLPPGPGSRRFHHGTLWLELDVGTRRLKLCFDLFDGGAIASPDGLHNADVYFKRSFDAGELETLDPRSRQKVRPLGLNFGCLGDADKDVARRTRIERRLRHDLGMPLTREEWSARIRLMVSSRSPRRVPAALGRFLVPRESAFRTNAGAARREVVVFQPRVYAPDMAPKALDILELNEQRVALVRALRRQFGQRFVGGLFRNRFAEQHYPDCLTPFPDDQWNHIRMLRTCSVAVVTEGIHGSIPWKVPEYLAAGLAIVSTPLRYRLPTPLVPEEHLLPYTTEDECIAACDRLLSSPTLRRSMETANLAYFDANVQSERLMSRCLDVAAELVS